MTGILTASFTTFWCSHMLWLPVSNLEPLRTINGLVLREWKALPFGCTLLWPIIHRFWSGKNTDILILNRTTGTDILSHLILFVLWLLPLYQTSRTYISLNKDQQRHAPKPSNGPSTHKREFYSLSPLFLVCLTFFCGILEGLGMDIESSFFPKVSMFSWWHPRASQKSKDAACSRNKVSNPLSILIIHWNADKKWVPRTVSNSITHMLHVWYIYLHLGDF